MNWNIKNLFKRKQENKQESKRNYFWKKKPRIDSDVRKFEKELNERSMGLTEAIGDRLDENKGVFQGNINRQIRASHQRLIDVCRNLAMDNPFGARYSQMTVDNVVGSGLFPRTQMTLPTGELDQRTNKQLDKMFYRWSENKERVSLNGQFDFYEFCQLAERQRIIDGEVFIILHHEDGDLKLEMIPADRCDITFDRRVDDNQVIKGGIKYDERTMKPVSYWFKKVDLLTQTESYDYVEYDAEEVIHYFEPKQIDQLRGISDFVPVIKTVSQLDAYIHTSIIQARVTASSMAFITQQEKSESLLDTEEEENELIAEYSPGTINLLNPGQDIKSVAANTQANEFTGWVNQVESIIAMGLGCFKQALTGDITGVNYSSARFGDLMQQSRYKALQRRLINTVLTRVYREFLHNLVDEDLFELPVNKVMFDTTWIKPAGKNVDPEKEIKSKILMIDNGLTSRRQVIEEMGLDPDKVDLAIAEDDFKPAEKNPINKSTNQDNPQED
ncbi:phage portal protein [Atlantibacter hermannii]|uniref:Putative phage portal protein n=1 Tax=Atlantibacter hermannii NBRC 105704 TaxID=1115512 RepID=H5V1Z7_ATLHE|nr:phage portal protein [Atlantibacter hermannii]QPS93800.1 phage portal protein [Atlantibacter hermannii]GAB52005.1 putative phage portal protein [Atlantibacter hermannii NBRC 105704]VDZ73283.1 head-tail preconnector protein from phage origin [Atlantibacter hermannii]